MPPSEDFALKKTKKRRNSPTFKYSGINLCVEKNVYKLCMLHKNKTTAFYSEKKRKNRTKSK